MLRDDGDGSRARRAASFLHDQRIVDVFDRVVETASRGGFGIRIIDLCGQRWRAVVGDALEERLDRLGYVTLRVGAAHADGLVPARHVALIVRPDDDPETVARMVTVLALASARNHLLVRLKGGEGSPTNNVPSRAESGRAVARLVSAGWRHLSAGAFDRVASTVAALDVVDQVVGVPQGADADSFRLAAGFWQGRFTVTRGGFTGPRAPFDERSGWRALLAWARGDDPGFRRERHTCLRWARCGSGPAHAWWLVLERLSGHPVSMGPASGHDHLDLLGELALVECGGDLRQSLSRRFWQLARETPAGTLAGLCALWLRARAGLDGSPAGVARAVAAAGALGVLRWGLGRDAMRVLQFVPGLLQVVHEAEDDRVALAAACAWVRSHAHAQAVAVVAEDGQVVAEVGWGRRTDEIPGAVAVCRDRPAGGYEEAGQIRLSAPVRYGSAVLGHVVAETRVVEADEARDAVQALAALAGPALRAALDPLTNGRSGDTMPEFVGRSAVVDSIRSAVAGAARTPFAVLIEGESGTGKELVARALHRLSARANRRFVAVNCAAFTDELLEAELFGFARGAFTGALTARAGLVEEAAGGTLFLDEVADLSARAQAKLLRTLQEREVRRVGENTTRSVDVRVVAATNRPLADAVAAGRFRGDLLFRLAVVRITLPPLRERLEDLPLLVAGFWRRAMCDVGKTARLSRDGLAALGCHPWPGNVRELQNAISALAVRAPVRGRVSGMDVRALLSSASGTDAGALPLGRLRHLAERRAVACALVRHAGRRSAAAQELGLSRQGLLKAIRRLGLNPDDVAGVA